MPKPPPRSSSRERSVPCSSRAPGRAGRRPGARRPRSPRCRRSASRCGCAARPAAARGSCERRGARPRRRARRSASEKPNFWSSWAVAMNSWVCASTPTVDPDQDRRAARRARCGSRGEPGDLVEGVEHEAADAGVDARRPARRPTCCCRGTRSARPGSRRASATASSPPLQTSRLRPSSRDPARHGRAQERLARVVARRASARTRRRTPRRGPGSRASSRTNSGVPYSSARSRTSMPPTVIASAPGCRPASRAADRGHTAGSSACNAAGSTGASGAACAATCSPCRGPAGWARMSARLPRRARNGRSGALRAPAGPACWVSQPELQMRSGATTPSHARPAASWLLVAAASQIRAMWPGPTVPHPSGSAGPVASNAR